MVAEQRREVDLVSPSRSRDGSIEAPCGSKRPRPRLAGLRRVRATAPLKRPVLLTKLSPLHHCLRRVRATAPLKRRRYVFGWRRSGCLRRVRATAPLKLVLGAQAAPDSAGLRRVRATAPLKRASFGPPLRVLPRGLRRV